MARWDVHRNRGATGATDTPYVLDVQADLLAHLGTRVIVPLRRSHAIPRPMAGLQPRLRVEDVEVVMDTPRLVGAPVSVLGERVTSLRGQSAELLAAIDLLLTGV